jgi:hypothetical protein
VNSRSARGTWRPQPPGRFHFRVEVPFGPKWQHAELLRMAVLQCLTTIFQSHDFCEQLAMITGELVENAIHYGDLREPGTRVFALSVVGDASAVTVEVANPINPERNDPSGLVEAIERMHAAPTVGDAYLARMREIADVPLARGSGLGLLRVAYETGCRLEATVVDGTARVVATIERGA